jgi:hypothetical protein
MAHSNQQLSRNERQRQLNVQLSVLPTFTPVNQYQIHHINRATSPTLLQDLIELARATTMFTIDTEHDYYTHQPALIQIEFIGTESVVVLIETCHLPHASSVLFWLIRSLLKVILKPPHTIYAWGDIIYELTDFIPYGLFSWHALHAMNTKDIQYHFKRWYNKVFKHDCGLQSFEDDHVLCTCTYRPVKDRNNAWSLQKAIAYTFDEFLDKSRTKSRWSRYLDLANGRHFPIGNKKEKKICEELILYAVNDCLAVTKLLIVVEFDWKKEQLEEYNRSKQ